MMTFRSLTFLTLALIFCFPVIVSARQTADTEAETETAATAETTEAMVQKIIEIGTNDNHVQDHLDYLTNRIGPRLTGSEGLQAACEWARDEFERMGLESRIEQWGDVEVGFERGPATGVLVSPQTMKLEFGTNAWTAGTKGRILGKVFNAPKSMEELEAMRDSIAGAYLLTERPARRQRTRRRTPPVKPADETKSDDKAAESTDKKAEDAAKVEPKEDEPKEEEPKPLTREQMLELRTEIENCKPAGFVGSTSNNLILTGGRFQITMDDLPTIPSITLVKEQWDQIKKMVDDGEDVQVAFDIRNHFRQGPIPLYNVIAEIKGTEHPEQVVIVGGHIDSWDGATGATDNGAGCATTMEAARILMAAGVKPKRTIRFMLWSGEEQGLLGSRAYVEKRKEEIEENVSAVFVHDGGTNYVAGIICTEAMRPDFENVFAEAMKLDERAPFEIEVVESIRPRGGSDHVSFIRAGVPGFFWKQRGRATYSDTHHTQFDTYDTVVPEYQKHSSIVIALGALGTANLDHLLPREGVQRQ